MSETVTAEAGPTTATKFDTIDELIEAAEMSGLDCPAFERTDEIDLADASGFCGESATIALYADEYAMTEHLAEVLPFGIETTDMGVDFVRLVGPNWIINAPNADEVQEGLGGVVLRADAS